MNGLTWLGHSTVVIDVDGTRLVTDPVLGRRVWHLRREAAVDLRVLDTLAGILVSHSHFDHLDHASLRLLDRALPVVAPSGVEGSFGDGGSRGCTKSWPATSSNWARSACA